MLDIKWIQENPKKFDDAMIARKSKFRSQDILILYEEKKQKISLIQELQAKRNFIAKDIAKHKQDGLNTDILMIESKNINEKLDFLSSYH